MTNQFGRLIDRSRQLSRELRTASEDERAGLISRVRILTARARLVRLAIALATTASSSRRYLIILLFLTALFELNIADRPLARLHGVHGLPDRSLLVFLRDINVSLHAFELEVKVAAERRPSTELSLDLRRTRT